MNLNNTVTIQRSAIKHLAMAQKDEGKSEKEFAISIGCAVATWTTLKKNVCGHNPSVRLSTLFWLCIHRQGWPKPDCFPLNEEGKEAYDRLTAELSKFRGNTAEVGKKKAPHPYNPVYEKSKSLEIFEEPPFLPSRIDVVIPVGPMLSDFANMPPDGIKLQAQLGSKSIFSYILDSLAQGNIGIQSVKFLLNAKTNQDQFDEFAEWLRGVHCPSGVSLTAIEGGGQTEKSNRRDVGQPKDMTNPIQTLCAIPISEISNPFLLTYSDVWPLSSQFYPELIATFENWKQIAQQSQFGGVVACCTNPPKNFKLGSDTRPAHPVPIASLIGKPFHVVKVEGILYANMAIAVFSHAFLEFLQNNPEHQKQELFHSIGVLCDSGNQNKFVFGAYIYHGDWIHCHSRDDSDYIQDNNITVATPRSARGAGKRKRPKSIVMYASGHGYGHTLRLAEVAKKIVEQSPELKVGLRTDCAQVISELKNYPQIKVDPGSLDQGVQEKNGSLNIDVEATKESLEQLYDRQNQVIDGEVDWLKKLQPDLILTDISFLAGYIAEKCDLPCFGIGNFTWDWIYEEYLLGWARGCSMIDFVREGYATMGRLYQLPFGHQVTSVSNVTQIPLIARKGRDAAYVKNDLQIKDDKEIVLIAMRDFEHDGALLKAAKQNQNLRFISLRKIDKIEELKNITVWDEKSGITFADLMSAAKVVFSKLGYNILADCIANKTAIVWPRRDGFREDFILRDMAPRYSRQKKISVEDLCYGEWKNSIDEVIDQKDPSGQLEIEGAAKCAQLILQELASV